MPKSRRALCAQIEEDNKLLIVSIVLIITFLDKFENIEMYIAQ